MCKILQNSFPPLFCKFHTGIYPSSPPDLRPLCNSLPSSCLRSPEVPSPSILPSNLLSLLQLKPRLSQQHQVICIKQLPWQAFFEIVSYGLHYYVKQDWAKYRPLMHPNLDLKTFTLFTISFDLCRNSIIHTFNHIYHPFLHSNMPQSPPQNLMRHSIEGLLQVHKRHPQLLLFAKELFLNLPYNKDFICCTFTRAKSKLHLISLYSLSKPCLDYSFQHL